MSTKKTAKSETPLKNQGERFILRLYITGSTTRSMLAVKNLKKFCEDNLDGNYDLEVIDIYQQPESAVENQVIAAPTLVKASPLPLRRFVGDLSDSAQLADRLDGTTHGPAAKRTTTRAPGKGKTR